MDFSRVTVRVDESGKLQAVDVDGHPEPEGVSEEVDSAPPPHMGDEEYQGRIRSWWGG